MQMTASTEAGVEEFNNELAGRHHIKPDQPALNTDQTPATDPAPSPADGEGTMQPHDGIPSAHLAKPAEA
jgi:hypothetical protein